MKKIFGKKTTTKQEPKRPIVKKREPTQVEDPSVPGWLEQRRRDREGE